MGALHDEIGALEPGAHICFPYVSSDDHESTVAAFLREGLRRGERCMCVTTPDVQRGVRARLEAQGVPVARAREQGALLFPDAAETYGLPDSFDPAAHARFLATHIDDARAAGFNGFRGVGASPANLHDLVDTERLLQYEAAASEMFNEHRGVGLCTYDRRGTDAGLLVALLRAHPLALLAGRLCKNPFSDPTAYLLHQVGEAQKLDWMITQILSSEQLRQYDHAAGEALLREATALAVQGQRLRDEKEELRRAIESRDLLWGMIARRLREPLGALVHKLDGLLNDPRLAQVRGALESGREDVDALMGLTQRVEGIAGFTNLLGPLQPERVDLAAIARNALATFKADPARQALEVRTATPPELWGTWDRRRLTELVCNLLSVANEHSWGTALDLRVEPLGAVVRLTVRFHAVEVDPKAGAPGLAGFPGGPRVAGYDRMGLELWTTRELARLMGGTFGVSSFADSRVTLTAELPRGEGSETSR
jgi:signal transduction histidine kinase